MGFVDVAINIFPAQKGSLVLRHAHNRHRVRWIRAERSGRRVRSTLRSESPVRFWTLAAHGQGGEHDGQVGLDGVAGCGRTSAVRGGSVLDIRKDCSTAQRSW